MAIDNVPTVRYDSFAEHYFALKLAAVAQDSNKIKTNHNKRKFNSIQFNKVVQNANAPESYCHPDS